MNELQKPYQHQEWLAGHLAESKLKKHGQPDVLLPQLMKVARMETPEGKPVVVHSFSSPEHGYRVDVSRGSADAGNLVVDQTVVRQEVPGGNLPELHPARSPAQAQEIIDDLRQAR